MTKLVTKGGVEVKLIETIAGKAVIEAPGFRINDKGEKVPNTINRQTHVRALFPDGSVQVVNRKNLREVK